MKYVDSPDRLEAVAKGLAGAELVAADTEAAGYHRYYDRICVLQLSTRSETYVIDTLAVTEIEGIGEVLADPAVEVVFHDADYDLRLLARDFGVTVRGLFDTRLAAQFLGEPALGLAALAEKHLGVRLEKKYQRADWAERPLPRELIEYAAEDTRYLPALRDALRARLVEVGRLGWAEEEFRIQESIRWEPAADEGDAYLRLKGTRDLKPRQLAALRELHGWRERRAEERDVAPFRVLSNEALVELARRMPADAAALAEVPGAPRSMSSRMAADLLEAVQRAARLRPEELPLRPRGPGRPPPDAQFDATVERLRAARDAAAAALELDRGFLMPRAQLEEIARAEPRDTDGLGALPGIRAWQVEAIGDALVEALRRPQVPQGSKPNVT